jgi:peptidoglycan-N-acetylmuramic acid deacetylase
MIESIKRNKAYVIAAAVLVVLLLVTVCVVCLRDPTARPSSAAATSAPCQTERSPEITQSPVPEPTATPTPVPTSEPTPVPTPISSAVIENLNTKGKEWSFGYWAHKKDENGIEQMIYELEAENVAVTSKYNAITGHKQGKKVYLTFDEGYENGYTPLILDALKEKGVKAAFFLTGDFIDSEPELVKRMYEEGHILGNHTDRHPLMSDLSENQFREELAAVEKKLNKLLGVNYDMKYYRPPQGYFSERDLALAQNMGYRLVFWSFAYDDYSKPNESSEELIRKAYLCVTQSAHEGEVLLLHAVSRVNSQILGDVIDCYQSQGYTFASLDEY